MSGAHLAGPGTDEAWMASAGSSGAAAAPQPVTVSRTTDDQQRPAEAWLLRPLFERPGLLSLLFVAAYVLIDVGTGAFSVEPTGWTPWNPHAALAVALVAIGGRRYVAAIVVAVLLSEVVLRAAPAGIGSVLAAVAMGCVYGLAGWLVRRFTRWTRGDLTPRDLSLLLAVAVAAALVVCAAVGLSHVAAGTVAMDELLIVSLHLVIGEVLGVVVAAPALLLLLSGAWRLEAAATEARGRLGRDLLLFAAALATVLLVIFWLRPFDEFRMSYLAFVPVILLAVRQGLPGAVLAVPLTQVCFIIAIAVFAPKVATAFEFQMLMLALALTALFVGLLSSERDHAARRLAARERELRQQRSALSEAQRTASTAELAAALAHDLNQPLSAIGTYAGAARMLAERDDADRATLARTLDRIAAESARAGQYVRRMRDFFRTGAMHSERVDVGEVVTRAQAHLRDRLQRDGIELAVDLSPGLPPLRTDAVQFGAVLDNLLGNACDALSGVTRPRRIAVTATRLDGGREPMIRISVQDSGPGIAPELRAQLFSPLATSKPHGMGLGLALSRSIAERLGGNLSFDAGRSVTTFHLDLPTDE